MGAEFHEVCNASLYINRKSINLEMGLLMNKRQPTHRLHKKSEFGFIISMDNIIGLKSNTNRILEVIKP